MYRYNDKKINGHYIYLDDSRNPILLPCLFARFTQRSQLRIDEHNTVDYETKLKVEEFNLKEIGQSASYKICNHLGRFLEWIEGYNENSLVSLSKHTALPDEVINEYVNEFLIDECSKSEAVANQAVNSLTAYYDWLFFFFKTRKKRIGIKSAFRAAARNNNKSELAIKYLLPQTRELLYRESSSLLEEIVLRNGGELGCRTRENQGFLLHDYRANKKNYSGLLTLFKQFHSTPNKPYFEYHLSSLYTKYGRARTLYIPRYLLEKMMLYYNTERPSSSSNHLLVSSSFNDSRGQCIARSFGSDTFLKAKKKLLHKCEIAPWRYSHIQKVLEANTYHHLRHSFGTDLFYELCEGQNKNYESITTASAVYLETARRLGHKVDSISANSVTKTYIHSCGYREKLLRETVNYD